MPCISQAYPLPSYHWFITSKTYLNWPSSNSDNLIDQLELIHSNSRIFQLDGILIFKQALLSDSAKYRCVVNNTLGTALIETELIVTCKLFF